MKKALFVIIIYIIQLIILEDLNKVQAINPIIPYPNQLIRGEGQLKWQKQIKVYYYSDSIVHPMFDELLSIVCQNKRQKMKLDFDSITASDAHSLYLLYDSTLSNEAYKLNINKKRGVQIKSATASGFFYGLQTLIQLLPFPNAKNYDTDSMMIVLPELSIHDKPRFSYRGMMLDVGRHYMPKEYIFKLLDQMARYKLNQFHFHLTEDQGWRLQIEKYPLLTNIGSRRSRTMIGHANYYWPERYDTVVHQGYYSRKDIQDIIEYAAERYINVIPEIEMPGHASAAIASYNWLSCGLEASYKVQDRWDVFDQVFCPKESTFAFLEDVLLEVIDLFPSPYIHIGGDECPKKSWIRCPDCQLKIKELGLKDEHELQSYFISRIERFLNEHGRQIIGWDEILEGGLAPNAIVMSWRGEKGGIAAAKSGHHVIMTPSSHCYFDYYQQDPEYIPPTMGGVLIDLPKVYQYNPIPSGLSDSERQFIWGAQANVWTEYLSSPDQVSKMTFPRLTALSEVLWTEPEQKSYSRFCQILETELKRLNHKGIKPSMHFFEANIEGRYLSGSDKFEVSLSHDVNNAVCRYSTTDSSQMQQYQRALTLTDSTRVIAAVYRDRDRLGAFTQKTYYPHKGMGATILLSDQPSWIHSDLKQPLIDAMRGYTSDMRPWTIFKVDTLKMEIKLTKSQNLNQLRFSTLFSPVISLWPVTQASILLLDENGQELKKRDYYFPFDKFLTERTMITHLCKFESTKCSVLKLLIIGYGTIPLGFFSEGSKSEFAIDELEIY